jgi:A/G-specific adenine glycosylase
MLDFATKITSWYKINKRELPWRNTNNPYFIWLSEIILQQTRVDQGMAYYLKFVHEFPTVKELAKAEDETVLRLWQGLGYYSRARNLHFTAKLIVENYNGVFPSDFQEIKKLKGVGEYTAAAIASFAFNLPHAVLDGNVFRVLSRIFGIDLPIDSTKGKKYFLELCNELLDKKNPALFNQAIMEFGALQCVPKNPSCTSCIFIGNCIAFSKNKVFELPIKSKSLVRKNRYFNYLIITHQQNVIIKKRTENDIWQNLYDFPLIETEISIELTELKLKIKNHDLLKNKSWTLEKVSSTVKHVLSHRDIYTSFFHIKMEDQPSIKNNYILCQANQLDNYGMPRVITRYLDSNLVVGS